jgi:hypothetical protein
MLDGYRKVRLGREHGVESLEQRAWSTGQRGSRRRGAERMEHRAWGREFGAKGMEHGAESVEHRAESRGDKA